MAVRVAFRHAFFIKLGRKGMWEEDSIRKGILRFGWRGNPIKDINGHNWDKIRRNLTKEHSKKATVTSDVNRLKDIVLSTAEDIWITFHKSKLYWCQLAPGPVKEDSTSRFRHTLAGWSSADVKGKELVASQIPGSLSKVQGYRATACSVKDRDVLSRVINAEPSPFQVGLESARNSLIAALIPSIQALHWKDFEMLVDLLFRAAGWKRISVLGETKKDVDIELEEPINRERYQVQIKASASLKDFQGSVAFFSPGSFRHFYFIVHSPKADLARYNNSDPDVKIILAKQLAEMTVSAGLVDWLMTKVW